MAASQSEEVILFDLPTKEPQRCWSYNPWKARMLLNYKGIPYKTEWTEYPDLKPRLEGHVAPDEDGMYTSPTIKLPDGTYIMDSWTIAARLEELYPNPPLEINPPVLATLRTHFVGILGSLRTFCLLLVRDRLLSDKSVPYFNTTRMAALGMTLEEYSHSNGGLEGAFAKAAGPLREMTALLAEGQKKGGPFFDGKTVSFADMVWAGLLLFFQVMGEDVFQEVLKRSGDEKVHLEFLEGMKPWTERNDH